MPPFRHFILHLRFFSSALPVHINCLFFFFYQLSHLPFSYWLGVLNIFWAITVLSITHAVTFVSYFSVTSILALFWGPFYRWWKMSPRVFLNDLSRAVFWLPVLVPPDQVFLCRTARLCPSSTDLPLSGGVLGVGGVVKLNAHQGVRQRFIKLQGWMRQGGPGWQLLPSSAPSSISLLYSSGRILKTYQPTAHAGWVPAAGNKVLNCAHWSPKGSRTGYWGHLE